MYQPKHGDRVRVKASSAVEPGARGLVVKVLAKSFHNITITEYRVYLWGKFEETFYLDELEEDDDDDARDFVYPTTFLPKLDVGAVAYQ